MAEIWLLDDMPLVSLGFNGTSGQIIYIPIDAFHVPAAQLIESYHSKVIIKRIASGRMLAVDVPIVNRDNRPWGKWRINKGITSESGLISFQLRAVNQFYRLLVSQKYRGIIFDAIGEMKSKEQ